MIKPELIRLVLDQFAIQVRDLHGPLHWLRLAANGRRLAVYRGGAMNYADVRDEWLAA